MFGKVLEVFDVERGERKVMRQAAGRDPHVVVRARAASSSRGRGEFPPRDSDVFVSRENWNVGEPAGEFAPVVYPQLRILGQAVSSPSVTKVITGSVPNSLVANFAESRPP